VAENQILLNLGKQHLVLLEECATLNTLGYHISPTVSIKDCAFTVPINPIFELYSHFHLTDLFILSLNMEDIPDRLPISPQCPSNYWINNSGWISKHTDAYFMY
jgi:hypothetical protein